MRKRRWLKRRDALAFPPKCSTRSKPRRWTECDDGRGRFGFLSQGLSSISPNWFMYGLKAQLDKLCVKFFWRTEVTGFVRDGTRIRAAQTSGGDFFSDEFVLCGGAWSPVVAPDLGLTLPMQAGKGYSLTLRKPRQLPQICALLTEARVAVTPMGYH